MRLALPLVLTALTLAASAARAATPVPLTLNTSGYLLDASDRPVTANGLVLGFSLWSDPDSRLDSNRVWPATGDSACTTDVLGGHYTVMLEGNLGSGCGAGLTSDHLPGMQPRWLQVSVDGNPLLPRLRVGAVPVAAIAVHALDAATVGGETPAALHDASKLTGLVPAGVLGTGSSGIGVLGTITEGTWQGTPVADAYVASAAAWHGKLATVAHDGTLTGSGHEDAPLGVVVGSTQGTIAAGDDERFGRWSGGSAGLDAATGRASLGLGTAATTDAAAYATAAQGTKADQALATTGGAVTGAVEFPGGVWTAAGSVGIGQKTPAAKLDVTGDARVTGKITLGDSSAISPSQTAGLTGRFDYPYVYTFTLAGDAFTFYPVAFLAASNGAPPGRIVIARHYGEPGPTAPAPDASHLGGLMAQFETMNTAWADFHYLTLQSYRQTYVRLISDCGNLPAATDGHTLWCRLRGGGYVYHVWANYPVAPTMPAPGSNAYNVSPYSFSYPGTIAAGSLATNAFTPGSSIVPVAAF